jgi:hypothetical protein
MAMLAFIVFTALIAVLVAAIGTPYRQTWYGRWHG